MSTDAKQGDSAMTQTNQIRARYARMYAAGIITLLAATVATAAWTKAPNAPNAPSQPAMDVSAIMSTVDIGNLPVQWHVDAI
jgi:hypothetical protein